MAKGVRFGRSNQGFVYTSSSLRSSVMRSLKRLGSSYLDVLFLHDVEFVVEPVYPQDPTGDSTRIINDDALREARGLHQITYQSYNGPLYMRPVDFITPKN